MHNRLSLAGRLPRRSVLAGALGLVTLPVMAAACSTTHDAAPPTGSEDPTGALAALEVRYGGRLGVCLLDTTTGRYAGHRLDERFAMCSTFKLPLAGLILREIDSGRLSGDERLAYTAADVLSVSPVTSAHAAEDGMTVLALAQAAQETSDNTAANLLLRRLGGPEAFTRLLRATGDTETRLDNYEPDLNLVKPGETHDTTTPRAMAGSVGRFVAGDVLAIRSRDTLIEWMVQTRTGTKRLRAGFPSDWRAGDKTGSGMADAMTDKYNDVAAAWPPAAGPFVVAAYYDTDEHAATMRDEDEAVLAEAGRIAARWALAR